MTFYKSVALLVGVFTFIACKQSNTAHSLHAHDTVTIPYTGYSKQIEVFADVQPFAVGTNSELVVHFTDLKTFKPIDAEQVTAMLIVGKKGLRQTTNEADKTGIYRFVFQPNEAGIGHLKFKLVVNGNEQTVSIPNVEVYADTHNAVHLAEELIPTSPNAITFTKEQSWKVDFQTQLPSYNNIGNSIKTVAKVSASPLSRHIVAAKSNGFAQFTSGIISEGRAVKNNEWLMTILGDGLTENNAIVRLQDAKVELEIAKAGFDRDKRLIEQSIVSESQLLESKSRYDKANTQWSSLQKTMDQSGEKVMVKHSGFIHELLVQNGEFVKAGASLFTVISPKRMVLKAMVPTSHLIDLQSLYDATIELDNGKVIALEKLNGRIVSVAQSVSEGTYLLPVILEVDYHQALVSGGFANVYLITKSEVPVVVVPETAIAETQGLYFVYTQLTPELFERRQVMIGVTDGQSRVITSGLKSTERIVSRGATLVKLAAISNTIDPHAGHVH